MINYFDKIKNMILFSNHFDDKSNFRFADKLQLLALSNYRKADYLEDDETHDNSEVRHTKILNWMLNNQDFFGQTHKKNLYDMSSDIPVGQPRPVIHSEDSYYNHTFDYRMNISYHNAFQILDKILDIYPAIKPKEAMYLLQLSKTGFFYNKSGVLDVTEDTINQAFEIPKKHGVDNLNTKENEVIYYMYAKSWQYRNIPLNIIKQVLSKIDMTNKPIDTIANIAEVYLKNYLYYGNLEHEKGIINMPNYLKRTNRESIEEILPLYKNIYNFAIENSDKWGNDPNGLAIAALAENITEEDKLKSDNWKIAKAFYILNNSTYDIENKLLTLQNLIHKIYKFEPNTAESDKLLIFFSKFPNTIGIPLSMIEDIENYANEKFLVNGTQEVKTELPKILNIFGKVWMQWINKFGTVHEAAQMLPFGKLRDLTGLGQFLLNYHNKYNQEDLTMIANGWKKLNPEQRKLPIEQLKRIVYENQLIYMLDNAKITDKDFAIEAAKWWQYEDDSKEDEDVNYENLEKQYLESQNIPLPEWTKYSSTIENLTGRFLSRTDPRGMFLGFYSNSCQHPWGAGSECAEYGQISPKSAFFIVEDDKTKDIVAQSWVWEDINGNVVFDNVEAKGIGSKRMPIVKEIYKNVAKQMSGRIVNIGEGMSDLDINDLSKAKNKFKLQEDIYSDAISQRLLSNNKS